ncbi:MAG: hypothetical protein ACI82A_000722 [Candidatus Azotimanducaceae bacterium]|jgi:hypothetical protein
MSELAWIDGVGLAIFTLAAILLFQPRISKSARWRATVTPLAEFAMAIIVFVSFGLGSEILYTIVKKTAIPDTQLPLI